MKKKQFANWTSRVRSKPRLLVDRFEEFKQVYESVVTTKLCYKLAG
jgi:hypothetical protein